MGQAVKAGQYLNEIWYKKVFLPIVTKNLDLQWQNVVDDIVHTDDTLPTTSLILHHLRAIGQRWRIRCMKRVRPWAEFILAH